MKKIVVLALVAIGALVLGACDEGEVSRAKETVNENAEKFQAYIPKNNVELNNYNQAQRVYDSPSTIIWCTAFPQASTAPLVTVPIAGKLTSSSTTFFRPEDVDSSSNGKVTKTARSVDGLYHPNPPKYRYGFTPGGEYVDFFNLPTLCTTKPLAFQRESVAIKVDDRLERAQVQAEAALKQGDKGQAQAILEGAAGE
jgi:hypothetical protein